MEQLVITLVVNNVAVVAGGGYVAILCVEPDLSKQTFTRSGGKGGYKRDGSGATCTAGNGGTGAVIQMPYVPGIGSIE